MTESKSVKLRSRLRGVGAVEVIVIAGIVAFAMILLLMALPRGREASRMAGCQRNLMQVGVGLQMYHQSSRTYPTIPVLGQRGDGPIKAMLDAFVIPDLLELRDPSNPPKPTRSSPKGSRVPGLACPSDSNAMVGPFISGVSYRANAGEEPDGGDGPFRPGRTMTSDQIEAADGLAYTAAFAERLVGDGKARHPIASNYALSPTTVARDGCANAPVDRWRGDSGSDWAEASWRSTLYNQAKSPNAPSSCIAEDGQTAQMGASSGHVNRVNVLLMDGSLRVVASSIDRKIWRDLATVGIPAPTPTPGK